MSGKIRGVQARTEASGATPFAVQREAYLKRLADEGRGAATMQGIACRLAAIARHIDISRADSITPAIIEHAADQWAARKRWFKSQKGRERTRRTFVSLATGWLTFLDRLRVEEDPAAQFADVMADFGSSLAQERGLSPVTLRTWSGCVRRFLTWYLTVNRPLSEIRIEDIEAYFAVKQRLWKRKTIAGYTDALRAFFRHGSQRGWASIKIPESILKPRIFPQEGLPNGPAWDVVQRLLDGTKTDRPVDIRDRAILLLFAVYGFRSGEVLHLRLGDINWETEIITLVRTKPRKFQQYPLTRQIGDAIIQYLREVRPRSSRQEVFLSARPPFRPLTLGGFYDMTRARYEKLGITAGPRGPHSLRHACAGHLLAEGFTLKEIGDHLGHRDPQSTRVYTKVDLAGLRQVANFDLGGLV
jgi:integrase/recombinase XerD